MGGSESKSSPPPPRRPSPPPPRKPSPPPPRKLSPPPPRKPSPPPPRRPSPPPPRKPSPPPPRKPSPPPPRKLSPPPPRKPSPPPPRKPSPPPPCKPSPPPSPEFHEQWRKMPWGSKATLEKKLRNFKLATPDVKHVRILIVGEVGAGKSSFINSVNNAFQKRITCGALVDATSGTSFTKVFKTHYIKGKDGSRLPFVFNDIMGLEHEKEPDENRGAHVQDIVKAIKGSLQEGYKFNPVNPVSENDSNYKSNPTVSDQTFCLVNVVAADKVSLMDKTVIQKLKQIREEASKYNLPQVIVMTKVDHLCPLVKKDIRKVYTSKKVKQKMQECSNLLGIPVSNIFPVKNYHEEVDTDNYMDVLILKALDQIVNIANDALTEQTCGDQFE